MPSAHATLLAAALGDELTESEASVRVFLTAGGLAVLGFALLLFTIWWWRGTKPEPPALGPLEVMGDRRWGAATEGERQRMIDRHRPDGALGAGRTDPLPIDLSVLARDLPTGFDDLRDDAPEQDVSLGELAAPVAASSDAASTGRVDDEPATATDATMHEVERPAPWVASANGDIEVGDVPAAPNGTEETIDDDHAQDAYEDEGEHGDEFEREVERVVEREAAAPEELIIDPLLQRMSSTD